MVTSCLNKNDFTYKLLEKAYGYGMATTLLLHNRDLDLSKNKNLIDRDIDDIDIHEITYAVKPLVNSLESKHLKLLSESNSNWVRKFPPTPLVAEHLKIWFDIDIYDKNQEDVEITYEELVDYIRVVSPNSMTQLPLLQMLKENIDLHKEKGEVFEGKKFKIILSKAEKFNSKTYSTETTLGYITDNEYTIRLFYDNLGSKRYSSNAVNFSKGLLMVLNHELLHAFTLNLLDTSLEFNNSISELYNIAAQKAQDENKDFYGITDKEEFISEAITNAEFQSFLASIPFNYSDTWFAKKPAKNEVKSIWDVFLDLVVSFFNKQYNKNIQGTLLEASIETIGNQIEKATRIDKTTFTNFLAQRSLQNELFAQDLTNVYREQEEKILSYWQKIDVITKVKYQGYFWIKSTRFEKVLENKGRLSRENQKAISMYGVPKFIIEKIGQGYTVKVNQEYIGALLSSQKVFKLSTQQGVDRRLTSAKKFLERRFGKDMAIDIFENTVRIGDEFAHGWFDSAGIHLWTQSIPGTEYHEAFHAVFRLYNSNSYQKDLLGEAKKIYGNLSDLELEERMADDFMEYVQSRRERSFLGKIMDFFKDLYNYLSSYFEAKPYIQSIYSQIYSGMINKKFKRSLSSLGTSKAYKRVIGYTKEETTQIIDVAGKLFIQDKVKVPKDHLFNNVRNWFLLNAFTINDKPLSKNKKDENYVNLSKFGPLITDYWELTNELDNASPEDEGYNELIQTQELATSKLQEFFKSYEDKGLPVSSIASTGYDVEQMQANSDIFVDIYTKWKTLVDEKTNNVVRVGFEDLLIDYLRNFGIVVKQKRTVEDNEEAVLDFEETEQTIEKIYNLSQLKEDLRNKLSTEVKEFLRLIEIDDRNFLGFNKLIDYEDIYLDIALTLVQNNYNGMDTTSFQGMITSLKEAGKTKPYLITVANKLIEREKQADGASFGSKFYNNFNNIYHRFLTVVNEFEDVYINTKTTEGKTVEEAKKELNIRIIESNRNSLTKRLLKDYETRSISTEDSPNPNVICKEGKNEALVVRPEKVAELVSLYNVFSNLNDKNISLNDKIKALSDFLGLMGATISPIHIQKYIEKGRIQLKKVNGKTKRIVIKNEDLFSELVFGNKELKDVGLLSLITHFASIKNDNAIISIVQNEDGTSKIQEEVTNIYSNYSKVFERFTKIEGEFAIMDTGTFVDSKGKPIYPINLPTMLSENIAELKRGQINPDFYKDKSFVPTEESENSQSRKSIFLHWFENPNSRNVIDLQDFDAFKEKNEMVSQHDFDNLNDKTSLVVRLNCFLNNGDNVGIFALPTLGDRGRMLFLRAPRLNSYNAFALDMDFRRAIEGYLYQDLEAIWQAYDDIRPVEQGGLPESQLIEGYHYAKGSTDKRNASGNAFKFWNLSGIDINTTLSSRLTVSDVNETSSQVDHVAITFNSSREDFMSVDETIRKKIINETIDNYLNDYIEQSTTKLVQKMIEYGVIEGKLDKDGTFIGYDRKGNVAKGSSFSHSLNKDAIRKLYQLDSNASPNDIVRAVAKDFLKNDIVVRNEITKITRARRGFTKNYEDFNKRFGATLTPGFKLAKKGDFPSHPDWGMPETFKEACIYDVTNDYEQADRLIEDMASLLPKDKKEYVNKYKRGKVNKSDAFGIVTLNFGRSILQGQGKWTSQHEEAYENYKAGREFKDNKGNAPVLMPIKAYYDGLVYQNGKMVPVMIKNSYQIILRDYTKDHPQLDTLLAKMKEQGIDAVNTITTRKLERHGMVDITKITPEVKWAKTNNNGYEVSTKGDSRFSALTAKLKDGRTIEEAYQLDVKGYRSQGNDWRLGKGRAPLISISREEGWNQYKNLWKQWAKENPELMDELKEKTKGKVLTDRFASTEISQARALAEILNETNNYNLVPSILPTKYFRIPQVIPNKHDKPLIGSQYRKEIISNLILDSDYEIEDFTKTGSEIKTAVSNVIDSMIQQSYNNLMTSLGFDKLQEYEEKYVNAKTVEEKEKYNQLRKDARIRFLNKLRDKISDSVSDRNLSENYTEALKIVYDNLTDTYRYQVSLSFPAYGKKFNQILFSIFRNNVMQQRIGGMSAVQIAELGGWKRLSKEENKEGTIEHLGFVKGKDGKVVAAECAVKWKIAEKFGLKPGESLENIPEELRRLIGYRIPTQGKNSMLPLVIKYVLPDNYDHAILVPGEITTQMGSDFDVDKLFLITPNLNNKGLKGFVDNYLKDKEIKDVKEFWTNERIELFTNYRNTGTRPEEDLEIEDELIIEAIDAFYEATGDQNAKAYVSKVKPNWDIIFSENKKTMQSLSREELENALFDLNWSILTNPEHFADLIEPRDDERLPYLAEYFKKEGYFEGESQLDFNDPLVEQTLEMRNKAGSKGIGIYANFLSGHNISQYIPIKLPDPIIIRHNNNEGPTQLEFINNNRDQDDNLIATNISAHLGISVDNAKDPIMYFINDNTYTSNFTGLLLTMGVTLGDVTKIRMSPMIREFVKLAQLRNASIYEYSEIKNEIFKKYGISQQAVDFERTLSSDKKSIIFNIPVIVSKTVTSENVLKEAVLLDSFLDASILGGQLIRINKFLMADRISDMSSLGAIENFKDIVDSVKDFVTEDDVRNNYPISSSYYEMIGKAISFFTESGLFLNTLTSSNKNYLKQALGRDVIDGKVYEIFHKDLLYYLFQLFPENKAIFTESKFQELFEGKNNLVAIWSQLKKEIPELKYNKFFNNFYTRYDKKTDYQILHFNSSLRSTKDQKDTFVDNFRDMLYHPEIYTQNEELQKKLVTFAENLIYANLWRFGFDTTSSSITDIIPMEWFSSKSYFRILHSMQQTTDLTANGYAENFMDDFVLNNTNTKGLIKTIRVNDKTIFFEKGNNSILNVVSSQAIIKENTVQYFKVFDKNTREYNIYKATGKTFEKTNVGVFVEYKKMNYKGIPFRFKEYNVFTGEQDKVLTNSIIKKEKAINIDPEMATLMEMEATVPVDKPTKPLGDIVDFVRGLEKEDKKLMLETLRHPKSKTECK